MKKVPQHHSVWTGNTLSTSTATNGLPTQEDIVDDDSHEYADNPDNDYHRLKRR